MFKIISPTKIEDSEFADLVIIKQFELNNYSNNSEIIELDNNFSSNVLRINLRNINKEEKINFIKSVVKNYIIKITTNQLDIGYEK